MGGCPCPAILQHDKEALLRLVSLVRYVALVGWKFSNGPKTDDCRVVSYDGNDTCQMVLRIMFYLLQCILYYRIFFKFVFEVRTRVHM